jgi:ferric-dicitrate binding protein FerR (iron transport regulator)
MKEEKNLNKIAKYLSDNSSSEEREDLFAWVKEKPANKQLLEDSMELWEQVEASSATFQPKTDAAWEKMEARLNKARGAAPATDTSEAIIRPISFFKPWMKLAVAAVILLAFGIWFLQPEFDENWMNQQTIAGEKTTIDLPDGSKIWLNQNSKVKYEKLFDKRIVYLEGEAFFEVQKKNGKPFEVIAGDSKTTVLGTAFNVRAYPKENKVELAVEEGKVAFAAEETPNDNALLVAGEYATYTKSSQEIEKEEMTKLNAAAWKKGTLRFKNTQMDEVIESLERYYDIEIEVSDNDIFNCTWNTTSAYNQPILEDILQEIDFSLDSSILIKKKSGNSFLFSGEGCK